jgi:hypothetical protein
VQISSWDPQLRKDLQNQARKPGVQRLGATASNCYYCRNYMAPLHRDRDCGWSMCCQLHKATENNLVNDEFNFVYAQWGIYIRTRSNTVWQVDVV